MHFNFIRRSGAFSLRSPEPNYLSPFVLFAIEGAMLQFLTSINSFGNNLYATNLGATDTQLSLVQMIPNIVTVLLLLPLGIMSDHAKNSRVVPLCTLFVMVGGYLIMSSVPAADGFRIPLFFFSLIFTVGGVVMYNSQWQTFFGDVVEEESRNMVLTRRNRLMFVINVLAPIVCGLLMGKQVESEGKLHVLQLFFLVCSVCAIIQAFVISSIKPPARSTNAKSLEIRSIGSALNALFHHKDFILFFIPIVLFYATWQADWSMWYIGEVKYLEMTETQLSITNGIASVGQLVAIGMISKIVQRHGPDSSILVGCLGIIAGSVNMNLCTYLPFGYRVPIFSVLLFFFGSPQCALTLCIVQILLRVAPKQYRGIAISLYTLAITATNCFMPYVGVKIYTALGSNLHALLVFNRILTAGRVLAASLLLLRYLYIRKTKSEKLQKGIA